MSDNKREMSSAETAGKNQHNNDLVIVPRDDIKELQNLASELIRLMGMVKFGNQSDSGKEGEQQLRQAFKIFNKEAPGWEGIIAKLRAIREDGPSPKEETAQEVALEPTNKESLEKEFINALRKFTAQVNNDEVQSKLIETQKDITETLRQISVTLGAPKCMMFKQKHPVIFEYYPFAASDVPADPTDPPRPLMQIVGSVETGVQVGTPAKELGKGGTSKDHKRNQHLNDGRVSTSGSKMLRAEGDEDAGEKPAVKKKPGNVGGVKPEGKNGS